MNNLHKSMALLAKNGNIWSTTKTYETQNHKDIVVQQLVCVLEALYLIMGDHRCPSMVDRCGGMADDA